MTLTRAHTKFRAVRGRCGRFGRDYCNHPSRCGSSGGGGGGGDGAGGGGAAAGGKEIAPHVPNIY